MTIYDWTSGTKGNWPGFAKVWLDGIELTHCDLVDTTAVTVRQVVRNSDGSIRLTNNGTEVMRETLTGKHVLIHFADGTKAEGRLNTRKRRMILD